MPTIKFYLLDVAYRIVNDKAQILLFGTTQQGVKVTLIDVIFEPYFYAQININSDVKEQITVLRVIQNKDSYFVTRTEQVRKKLFEQETIFLKISVNIPQAVPVLKEVIKKINGVTDVYEHDIPFARRYLLDKNITPMKLLEAECDENFHIKQIINTEDKTLQNPKILAIDIETYFDEMNKKITPEENPILMISLYSENFKKTLTWKKFATQNSNIEFLNTEAEMILRTCELIRQYSPDIITGYYSDGFDFPYLNIRAQKNNIPLILTNQGTRLRISDKKIITAEIKGIVHVDVFRFIRRIISRSMQTDSFTLDAVAAELLGERKQKVELGELSEAWNTKNEELEKFCDYNIYDAKLTFELCKKILPTMTEFVTLIGLPLFDINRMTFSQLVEAYIIKNAQQSNEVIPNKPTYQEKQQRLTKKIKGAFVFEPKPGLYHDIAIFDYRSLYPSIIVSHNISPGTLNCNCCKGKTIVPTEKGQYWFCDKQKGFLSSIIAHLINIRAEIKKQIKQGKNDQMTLARSEALKVLANSFYGYLGFNGARWYCKEGAESTTAFGRQYIHKVIDSAQQQEFKILYSDTDSVFILLDKKTKEDALNFIQTINKELPNMMELDYEGLYPAGIFVAVKEGIAGAKKKYALIDEKGTLKIRGFETVRRNWSFIAKDTQKNILEIILRENNPNKAIIHLQNVINDLRTNKIPLQNLVIQTQLQRELSTYKSISPHVATAQRMQQKGLNVEPGMMLKFVIVKGKGKIRDKVRLPEETKQEDCDAEYYINHQIIPSVEKILSVLGFDKLLLEALNSSNKQL